MLLGRGKLGKPLSITMRTPLSASREQVIGISLSHEGRKARRSCWEGKEALRGEEQGKA